LEFRRYVRVPKYEGTRQIPVGLDGEGQAEIVNRWPDTNHAENLRLAIAGQIPFRMAENDCCVCLESQHRCHHERGQCQHV
jgi:hypothetical protein